MISGVRGTMIGMITFERSRQSVNRSPHRAMRIPKKIPKDILGLAGEFAVASELCKRGVYAQLTLGNRKRIDLLVESDNCMLRIQVKSKQGQKWPAVKGIAGNDIYLVFVDFRAKDLLDRPAFFILSSLDWEAFTKRELIDTGLVEKKKVTLNSDHVPTHHDKFHDFVGMSVGPEQLTEYREKWTIITERAMNSG